MCDCLLLTFNVMKRCLSSNTKSGHEMLNDMQVLLMLAESNGVYFKKPLRKVMNMRRLSRLA